MLLVLRCGGDINRPQNVPRGFSSSRQVFVIAPNIGRVTMSKVTMLTMFLEMPIDTVPELHEQRLERLMGMVSATLKMRILLTEEV